MNNNSPITEYIHFYQQNYDDWGINRVNTIKSDTLQASFEEVKNQIKDTSELNKLLEEAKQIEKDYNDLFFPKTPTNFTKILKQIAQETLEQQFGAAAGRINISNLDVVADQSLQNFKKKVSETEKKIKINAIDRNTSTKQILNAINELSEVLLQLDDTENKTLYIQNRLTKAKRELKQIKKRIENEAGVNQNLDFLKDIETINKFIQQFNRSFAIKQDSIYNQRGDLFEWLSPLIQLKSTNLVGNELKKAMRSLIKSGNVGGAYTEILFPDFLNMSDSQLSTSLTSDDFQMKIENVRNRTDVIIKYPIGNGEYKDLAVSDKSIKQGRIKLVEQTSLYRVLVFSENYDFIKHYLNIISWSEEGGKATTAQIIQANKLLRSLTMQLAAQGFDVTNPAQLLIIHNVKQKKIRVYNIKALIYIIKRQIMAGSNKYNSLIKVNGDQNFDNNFTIKQQKQDTVERRLRYLFNEINNKKITVYGNQFKDYLKELDQI